VATIFPEAAKKFWEIVDKGWDAAIMGLGLLAMWATAEFQRFAPFSYVVGTLALLALARLAKPLLFERTAPQAPTGARLDARGGLSPPAATAVDSPHQESLALPINETLEFRLRQVENVVQQAVPELQEANREIEQAKKGIYRNNIKVHHLENASRMFIDYVDYTLKLHVMRDLLSSEPNLGNPFKEDNVTDQWLSRQTEIAEQYIEHVKKRLGEVRLTYTAHDVFARAETDTDYLLTAIPQESRLQGVDTIRLRSYMVAKKKCERLIAFMNVEQQEAKDR
jgi:hypothetical protein